MPKAIFLIGSPYIGKTTWAQASFGGFHFMNSDTIDEMQLFPDGFINKLLDAAREKKDILIDGTNSTRLKRIAIVDALRSHEYECAAYHFNLDSEFTWLRHIGELGDGGLMKSDRVRRTRYIRTRTQLRDQPPVMGEGFHRIVKIDKLNFVVPQVKHPAIFFQITAIAHSSDDLFSFTSPGRVQICHDLDSLMKYHQQGYLLIGIGQIGNTDETEYQDCLIEVLKKVKPPIKEIVYCRHPSGFLTPSQRCSCRLPTAGLAYHAALKHSIDLQQSIMVGCDKSDELFAMRAGITRYYDREVFFRL